MDWILLVVIVALLLLVAFAMAIWSPELLNGASGAVIVPLMIAGAALGIAIASTTRLAILNSDAPLAMGLTAAYLAISLSLPGAQSPPILESILVTTVAQVLLQLSRPGKRFRRRLWPELAAQATEGKIA